MDIRLRYNKLNLHLLLLSLIMVITLTGCAKNYYITAYNLQQRGNYIGAIENYDNYIARSRDGELLTAAIRNRSESYYRLGLRSMENGNYRLAIRFFYLANNEAADEKLIDSYLAIIERTDINSELNSVLDLTQNVGETFRHVPAINRLLYRRLEIIHEHLDDPEAIFHDFELLAETDKDEIYIDETRVILDHYMPFYINRAKDYPPDEAIVNLIKLLDFTGSKHDLIKTEIGALYFQKGDDHRIAGQFQNAQQFYNLAAEYDPSLQPRIADRLGLTVNQMIERGDTLLRERKIGEAIDIYQRTFAIIPDNPAAQRAITQANELRSNIEEGRRLFRGAQDLERQERYQEALRLYQQSYAKDRVQDTSEKIFLMTNLIAIEDNPEAFARKIITEYKGGMIVRNLQEIVSKLSETNRDSVNVSGWRVMLSTGANRYEIRYDITSPTENHYFIWQVNLLNRQLTPLNKISQEIMGE